MSDDDLTQTTASQLGRMIRTKEVSSAEITEAVLARIEKLNPILSAFITVTPELARQEARDADARAARDELRGPLDGIPYSIKDLEPTAGIRTTYGSMFTKDNIPTENSAVADRLRSTGGVLLGKTNTPHNGYKDMCDNFIAPTAVNAWDTSKTSGASSGGAASAVAGGLGPLAQGGDGAGSIRIPAALQGIVGLKPTFGRVPLFPAKNPHTTRVHNGPLARTVEDAALLLSVMAGYDARDRWSLMAPLEPFVPLTGSRPLEGKRALFSLDLGYGAVSAEVERLTRDALTVLRDLGCEVVEKTDPGWFNPHDFHAVLYAGGGMKDEWRAHPDWVEKDLWDVVERGGNRTAAEISKAEADWGDFYQSVMVAFEGFDYFISPSMPVEAWSAVAGSGSMEVEGRPIPRRSFLLYPFNLTGHPAISIPSGLSAAGLPVSLQIVGKHQHDIEVLQAAGAVETGLALNLPWPTPTSRPEGLDAHRLAVSGV